MTNLIAKLFNMINGSDLTPRQAHNAKKMRHILDIERYRVL